MPNENPKRNGWGQKRKVLNAGSTKAEAKSTSALMTCKSNAEKKSALHIQFVLRMSKTLALFFFFRSYFHTDLMVSIVSALQFSCL